MCKKLKKAGKASRTKKIVNYIFFSEGGWGWIIVVVGFLVHILAHGLQLSCGVLLGSIATQYDETFINSGELFLFLFGRVKKFKLNFKV